MSTEMEKPEILPAPVIDIPEPRDDKWERERRAFYRMLPALLATSRGSYVAVHEEQVVETGETPADVAMRAYSRFGYVPIFVGLVSDQPPSPVRIPSPRMVRPKGQI